MFPVAYRIPEGITTEEDIDTDGQEAPDEEALCDDDGPGLDRKSAECDNAGDRSPPVGSPSPCASCSSSYAIVHTNLMLSCCSSDELQVHGDNIFHNNFTEDDKSSSWSRQRHCWWNGGVDNDNNTSEDAEGFQEELDGFKTADDDDVNDSIEDDDWVDLCAEWQVGA